MAIRWCGLWKQIVADDSFYMNAALDLAKTGLGRVSPNPSVGCVIVKNGKIVGASRTHDGGRPHAEAAALEQAGTETSGAAAYVTLEPCFRDDAPSCYSSLIKSGIAKVVIGCADENPAIKGRGISALKAAGIEVVTFCLEEECHAINKGFFLSKNSGRPLVTLKMAVSLDSKIATATGHSQWITGVESRHRNHLERARHDAILTGIGTIIADDPLLTTRGDGVDHKSRRIVLDTHLRFPPDARMLDSKERGEVIIFKSKKPDLEKERLFADRGARLIPAPLGEDGALSIPFVLEALAREGVTRLMVEGGQGVFTSFFASGLWDQLHLYRAPIVIGADGKDAFGSLGVETLEMAKRMVCVKREDCGDDALEVYNNLT